MALSSMGANLGKLYKSPQEALAGLTKAIFKIKIAFETGITGAWTQIKEAFFLGDGEDYTIIIASLNHSILASQFSS